MAELYPTIVTTRRKVLNQQPVIPPEGSVNTIQEFSESGVKTVPYVPAVNYRIALIGEAPGEDEENYGIPFVGASGRFLQGILQDLGVDRKRCFIGNICQVRPKGNQIREFAIDWKCEAIQEGLASLKDDLNQFQPNICVLLGNTPLHAAKDNTGGLKLTKDGHIDWRYKVSSWKGSLFNGQLLDSPFLGRKCISTFHPAFVLRDFNPHYALLKFNLKRAVEEAGSPSLLLPNRDLITQYDAGTLCHLMDTWPSGLRCSVDIEGGLPHHLVNDGVKKDAKKRRHLGWKCVSICGRPTRSFTIAWWKFSTSEHALVLRAFARLMYRQDVPKVLQNALYDAFVLEYGYAIPVCNIAEDTVLKGWEIYCELPKGLSTQASIWTREPHWKDDEMYDSTGEALAIGCAKDTAVTLEICQAQDAVLQQHPLAYQHYHENVALLAPARYMELRGIRYDQTSVSARLKEVTQIGWQDKKKGWVDPICKVADDLNALAGYELRGEKGSLSSQKLAKFLYEEKGYPPQYKKEEGRLNKNKLTTDAEAILTLAKRQPDDPLLRLVLRHRHLEGLVETLNIKADSDGRVRCAYNVVGTETGRFSCKTSPTGAGANLTTITKQLRYNYTADPGYDFFQCDLAGADGWTVASHCARLGDPTMLEDYQAGLKPAKIIAMLYAFGADVNYLSRDDLKFWSEKHSFSAIENLAGGWVYDGSKVVQHGRSYKMGIPTMQTNLMKHSFKNTGSPVYLTHPQAVALGSAMDSRYPGINTWHSWAEAQLVAKGELTSASGHTRMFFGRRFGPGLHETVKEFLADEPQQNTTYATNLAMLRLYRDPGNRIVFRLGQRIVTGDGCEYYIPGWTANLYTRLQPGSLLIEPLHQVHDAMCGQWPCFIRHWAGKKVKSYFDNKLTIAGRELTIPFDGAYGPSWGEQPNSL